MIGGYGMIYRSIVWWYWRYESLPSSAMPCLGSSFWRHLHSQWWSLKNHQGHQGFNAFWGIETFSMICGSASGPWGQTAGGWGEVLVAFESTTMLSLCFTMFHYMVALCLTIWIYMVSLCFIIWFHYASLIASSLQCWSSISCWLQNDPIDIGPLKFHLMAVSFNELWTGSASFFADMDLLGQ